MLSHIQAALRTPSGLMLLMANLIPVAGVLLWDWNVASLLHIYWAENVAIGIVNILKILTNRSPRAQLPRKLFIAAFFALHYGLFCKGHASFVFGDLINGSGMVASTGGSAIAYLKNNPWLFLSFLISHLFSFFTNYLGKGEAKTINIGQVMFLPYRRIMILHLTIIFGAFAIIALDSPIVLVFILAIAKILGDLFFHRREHSHSGKGE